MIKASDCRGGMAKDREFNLELRTRIYVENFVSTVAALAILFVSCWFKQLEGW